MLYHTGDDAENLKGLYERQCCKRVTRMKGFHKDKFPPCSACKTGTYYKKVENKD